MSVKHFATLAAALLLSAVAGAAPSHPAFKVDVTGTGAPIIFLQAGRKARRSKVESAIDAGRLYARLAGDVAG